MEGDLSLFSKHFTNVHISIHSLRMEGDVLMCIFQHGKRGISIHSLRMEGDIISVIRAVAFIPFQSTPSAWRETTKNDGFMMIKAFQSTPSAWRETVPLELAT